MNSKFLKFPLLTLFVVTIVMSCNPKSKELKDFKEVMDLENIEYTFINMDEYFPSKKIEKADQAFVFPQIRNIQLPNRKSTRLNSSHVRISYAVFCLKKK